MLHQLESSRVTGLLLRSSHSPLVSCRRRAGALSDEVHSRAIWLEGYGEGGAPIVLQPGWVQERVGVREGAPE